jgi:hypothetical protein
MLCDHLGRKPILALGFLLNSTLSLGLIVFHQFSLIAPAAILAGLGSAFIAPALGASYRITGITQPMKGQNVALWLVTAGREGKMMARVLHIAKRKDR